MDQIGEIALRTLCSYAFLLIITRIMGRKQIAELTFFDYVTGISIGTIAGTISFETRTSLASGLLALAFWTACTLLINLVTLRNIPARKLVASEPMVVIRDGQILEETLGGRFYTINNLLMQLRKHGIFDPSEVKLGVVEPDGNLSLLKNSQTLTKNTPSTIQPDAAVAKELIIDGQLLEENLNNLQLSKSWLHDELKKQGVYDIKDVSLAMITPSRKLYIDKKQDNPGTEKSNWLH